MPDREKIIKRLEHCIGDNCNGDKWSECEYSGHGCIDALLGDVIALLKALEPRVMTLEELGQSKGVWVWMERRSSYRFQGKPYGTEAQFHVCVDKGGNHLFVGRASRPEDSYEIEWRCWTSCPTDVQREATPWKKEDNT